MQFEKSSRLESPRIRKMSTSLEKEDCSLGHVAVQVDNVED
jgi:hypothetical protein